MTPDLQRAVLAQTPEVVSVPALEITHPDLAVPVRVVANTENVTIDGHEYVAMPFEVTRPDDVERQASRARLQVDNIGRELTQWLEVSRGGAGARCKIMDVLLDEPPVVGASIEMDLADLSIDLQHVTGALTFAGLESKPAVAVRYDPITAPGVFE